MPYKFATQVYNFGKGKANHRSGFTLLNILRTDRPRATELKMACGDYIPSGVIRGDLSISSPDSG